MTNEEIRTIAQQAFDATSVESKWDQLDAQYQGNRFDVATDIIERGGATTDFELEVAKLAAVAAAAPPPAGGAVAAKHGGAVDHLRKDEEKLRKDREEEKRRIAEWKGAVTDKEKERREKEGDRLDKEEDRIKKERAKAAQLPAPQPAPKNGPEKK